VPGLLADLVDELRNAGIPVSVGEHLDAAAAVASIPLNDREVLRAALAATMVKDGDHLGAFNLIFDLYTSGPPPGQGESPLAGLDDAELRDVLRSAIAGDDRMLMSLVADEYVRRFAGVEAGRPVAGVMYGIAVNRAADGIDVSVIYPISTATGFRTARLAPGATPVPQHATIKVQSAEHVARAIVRCLRRPKAEVHPFAPMRLFAAAVQLFPGLTTRLLAAPRRERRAPR